MTGLSAANALLQGTGLVLLCSAAGATAAPGYLGSHDGSARIAIVGRTVITQSDLRLAARSYGRPRSRAALTAELVNDAVLIDEAHRLHLGQGLSVPTIAAQPEGVAILNAQLYDYATRSVRLPADPPVRAYARLIEQSKGEDTDNVDDGFGAPPPVVSRYDGWVTQRDRIASAWFGRLYHRYRELTTYPTTSARR